MEENKDNVKVIDYKDLTKDDIDHLLSMAKNVLIKHLGDQINYATTVNVNKCFGNVFSSLATLNPKEEKSRYWEIFINKDYSTDPDYIIKLNEEENELLSLLAAYKATMEKLAAYKNNNNKEI